MPLLYQFLVFRGGVSTSTIRSMSSAVPLGSGLLALI